VGGCVAFFDGAVETNGAGEDAVRGLRDDAGKINDFSGGPGGGVVTTGGWRCGQCETEVLQGV